ncbi:EAL domain-containing protein [Thiobacillus sp.]
MVFQQSRTRQSQSGYFRIRFIGTAEENDLIDDLTHTVLTNVLHQACAWQAAGLHLQVAVNVSMDNLGFLEFPDLVTQAVARSGVPPTRLELEVTESRLMKDPLASLDILTRLRLKHIGLSIDDFGTGHSSVAEGVEDQEDWDFLRTSSCNTAQGYFIARPMPAADLTGWMAAWEIRRRDLMASRP